MRAINRRTFLALGVGAAAWACARKTKDEPSAAAALSLIPTGQVGLAVGDSRQGFALLRGQRPFAPEDVAVRLKPPTGSAEHVRATKEQIRFGQGGSTDHDHPEGTEVVSIYVVHHELDRAGPWVIDATVGDRSVQGAFQVLSDEQSAAPIIGEKAIASESPTTSDPRDVDPICTRTPACSMHEITIAEALQAGKPSIITFATPRFCQSRTCGPVVDLIEKEQRRVGDDASFVHVEVFRNAEVALKENGDAPAFAEWKLGTEPWIYFVGPDGTIKDRWLGALGPRELRRAVDALIAG